jgi:hypothetical protein
LPYSLPPITNLCFAMNTYLTLLRTGLLLGCMLILLQSCEENPPFTIDLDGTPIDTSTNTGGDNVPMITKDTTFVAPLATPQNHVVLIEEFTGVSCVNCPAGHDVTKSILLNNPNRVIAALIHAGFLTDPHPNSTQVFVTPETEALYDLMLVEAVPSAAINRTLFEGEPRLAITNKSQWGGRVASELGNATPVNLYLHRTYDPATRQVKAYVQLRYTQSVAEANNVTVYITENDIVDPQLLPDPVTGQSYVLDTYVHQHVVRDVLSATSGDAVQVSPPQNSGTVIVKTFVSTLSGAWNADNCHIVALVHQASGTRKVLQSAEIDLVE